MTNRNKTVRPLASEPTSGPDTLIGEPGDDTLRGLAGDDYLFGMTGDDVLRGGVGDDWLVGGENDDLLKGAAGDDNLEGGDGNDTLFGSPGKDWLAGGPGDDIYRVTEILQSEAEDHDYPFELAGEGYDIVRSSVDFQMIENIELLVLTGTQGLEAYGDWGANSVIHGSAGNDSIAGFDGDDRLWGRGGNDQLSGDVSYNDLGNDTLLGGDGDDDCIGGGGDDVLRSGSNSYADGTDPDGGDFLAGGLGNDLYIADNLAVIIIESENEGYDTVVVNGVEFSIYSFVERIVLGPITQFVEGWSQGEKIIGNAISSIIAGHEGNDTLLGYAGEDLLAGGRGDDRLVAGEGADELFGGEEYPGPQGEDYSAGADAYVFEAGTLGDIIMDFSTNDGDRIHLKRIDADAATEADDAFAFIGDAAFSGAAGELRYEALASGEGFMLYGETDGVAGADIAIEVRTVGASLELAHFVL